jgi:hypothetical protein
MLVEPQKTWHLVRSAPRADASSGEQIVNVVDSDACTIVDGHQMGTLESHQQPAEQQAIFEGARASAGVLGHSVGSLDAQGVHVGPVAVAPVDAGDDGNNAGLQQQVIVHGFVDDSGNFVESDGQQDAAGGVVRSQPQIRYLNLRYK